MISLEKQPTFYVATNTTELYPFEMTSDKGAQKVCTDDQIWVVLLIGWSKFSTNQKHYPDLDSERDQYGISALVSLFSRTRRDEYFIDYKTSFSNNEH